MRMTGSSKPTNVSEYTKLVTALVTSGVQFGFGHVKSAGSGPDCDCAGTVSLPFLDGVSSTVLLFVSDRENG
jgi:hypothetical protein